MSVFSLKRRMKRRWRRWRRAIWTFSICALVFIMAGLERPLSGELKELLTQNEPVATETMASLQGWDEGKDQAAFRETLSKGGQAYIGMDSSGGLSLFEGKPDKEKVMRTFFQIDIKSMETSLPKEIVQQLHEGIRVQDLDEYNSVISTFSDFALDAGQDINR